MRSNHKKLEMLQVFRGLAAFLVVAYHLTRSGQNYFSTDFLGRVFESGDVGVDFFFVLSGFIITYVHFEDLVARDNVFSFLKKRVVRIYPIYWIIATGYLFLLLFVANGKTNHHDHQIDLQSVNDWLYIAGCYLLIPQEHDFFLGVAWTLSYEMLFYLVFMIGIVLGFKKARFLFVIWAGVILLKIFIEIVAPTVEIPGILILNVRIVEFLTGCMVAYLILKSHKISDYLLFPLLAMGVGSLVMFYPHWVAKGWGILILALVNGLIIFRIVNLDLQRSIRYPKLFLLVGEASYSIYLSHIIFLSLFLRVFQVVVNKFGVTSYLAIQMVYTLILVFSVIGGILIYKYIESPVLRYLNRKFFGKKPPLAIKLEAQNA